MLTQARVVRDASFIGMKAYSHAFAKEDNLRCIYLCKGWSRWKENCYLSTTVYAKKKIKRKFNRYMQTVNAIIWKMKDTKKSPFKVKWQCRQNKKIELRLWTRDNQ